MGCRESKLQDVVTGNTVAQRKKANADSKRIVLPESRPVDKTGGLAAAAAEGGGSGTANGKEGESIELDRESERSGEEEEEEDVGRSVSRESPNHYFSSRKDDEPIDAISTEERSVYSSPPHEAAAASKDINREKTEDDDAAAAAVEPRPETEKIDGGEHMKNENLIKESETNTPPAEGLSIEEKIVNPMEENVNRSDKDDQNTKQE